MTLRVLITGFGPFPGAPVNPTGPLVRQLARAARRIGGLTITTHVFMTGYRAIDRDLPRLIAAQRPDLLLMFGLAARTPHLRVETVAQNATATRLRDAEGRLAESMQISPGGPPTLMFSSLLRHLLRGPVGARGTVRLSRDAGRYLCNYLCWKAIETTQTPDGPTLAAFIHIPKVAPQGARHAGLTPPRRSVTGGIGVAALDRAALALLRNAVFLARQEKRRRACRRGRTSTT